MTTIDRNDPRLTAYALGALDGLEAAEIEASLRTDAALRAEVDDIRETAMLLRAGFAAESSPGLTESQRQSIVQQPPVIETGPRLKFRGRVMWIGSGLAAAASLMFAVMVLWTDTEREGLDSVAIRSQERGDVERSGARSEQESAQEFQGARERLSQVEDPSVAKAAAPPPMEHAGAPLENEATPAGDDDRQPSRGLGERSGSRTAGGGIGGGSSMPGASRPSGASGPGSDALSPIAPTDVGSRLERGRSVRDNVQEGASSPAHTRLGLQTAFTSTALQAGEVILIENSFLSPTAAPISTFPVAVSDSSLGRVSRLLHTGRLPAAEDVRIEELINAFPYRYPATDANDDAPVHTHIEVNQAPWNPEHRLVRIGLTSVDKPIAADELDLQVEFNPAKVASYRLIGFDQVVTSLEQQHMHADADTGETLRQAAEEESKSNAITALYEIVPTDVIAGPASQADRLLRYQTPVALVPSDELLTLTVQFDDPETNEPQQLQVPVNDEGALIDDASSEFKLAASVASFGMILRDSPHKGEMTLDEVLHLTRYTIDLDHAEAWLDFVRLVELARAIKR